MRIQWNPATKPPEHPLLNVLMKGGNYAVVEGYWWSSTKEPEKRGFYLPIGGDKIVLCPWVEWWIPEPSLPK